MHRRVITFAMVAPIVGLGLLLVAKRQQLGPYVAETVEELAPEAWRTSFARQMRETSEMIDDTRQALEEVSREAQKKASTVAESVFDRARKAVVGTALASFWIGSLTAFLIFIYAPESEQRQRLWNTIRPVVDSVRGALAELWRVGGELRGSAR